MSIIAVKVRDGVASVNTEEEVWSLYKDRIA